MILINKLTRECINCSMTEAGKRVKRTPKTIGIWAQGSGLDSEARFGVFKEYGIWEMYFDPKQIKQDKGYRK